MKSHPMLLPDNYRFKSIYFQKMRAKLKDSTIHYLLSCQKIEYFSISPAYHCGLVSYVYYRFRFDYSSYSKSFKFHEKTTKICSVVICYRNQNLLFYVLLCCFIFHSRFRIVVTCLLSIVCRKKSLWWSPVIRGDLA